MLLLLVAGTVLATTAAAATAAGGVAAAAAAAAALLAAAAPALLDCKAAPERKSLQLQSGNSTKQMQAANGCLRSLLVVMQITEHGMAGERLQ